MWFLLPLLSLLVQEAFLQPAKLSPDPLTSVYRQLKRGASPRWPVISEILTQLRLSKPFEKVSILWKFTLIHTASSTKSFRDPAGSPGGDTGREPSLALLRPEFNSSYCSDPAVPVIFIMQLCFLMNARTALASSTSQNSFCTDKRSISGNVV